jgi:hypothetical protein
LPDSAPEFGRGDGGKRRVGGLESWIVKGNAVPVTAWMREEITDVPRADVGSDDSETPLRGAKKRKL